MAPRSARSLVRVAGLLSGLALLVGLAGCGGGPGAASAPAPPPLPAAPDLLSRSATAMSQVKTVTADLAVDPALTQLQVRTAHGTLTATGDAIGTAALAQGQSTVEFNFVVTRGSLYLKGATGGYQQLPLELAAGIYDPTALLSPDRGLAALLRTATGGVTEGREDVNGASAFRVRAMLDPRLLASVVPGLNGANAGTVWIDEATSHLVKAQVQVPGPAGAPPAPATVTLSEFNKPVTITPPA